MAFSLKKAAQERKLEPFPYEDLQGNPRQLPNLMSVSADMGEKAMTGRMREVFEELVPDDADMIMKLSADLLNLLVEQWMEHSGIEFDGEGRPIKGKSLPSSPSSRGTGTPSKPTSRSAASAKSRKR